MERSWRHTSTELSASAASRIAMSRLQSLTASVRDLIVSVFFHARQSEVLCRRSESQHDLVESDFVRMAVKAAAYRDVAALMQIDLLHLAHEERNSLQEFSRGIDDIRQIEISGRDFMVHRCEQKEVLPIVDIRTPSEVFSSSNAV
jgi:hypothetical protein